jgi:hypothetical protein
VLPIEAAFNNNSGPFELPGGIVHPFCTVKDEESNFVKDVST